MTGHVPHACEPELDCPVRSGEPCPTCEQKKCTHVMCQEPQ